MSQVTQEEDRICGELNRESAVGMYLSDELLSHCLRIGTNSMTSVVQRDGRQYEISIRPVRPVVE